MPKTHGGTCLRLRLARHMEAKETISHECRRFGADGRLVTRLLATWTLYLHWRSGELFLDLQLKTRLLATWTLCLHRRLELLLDLQPTRPVPQVLRQMPHHLYSYRRRPRQSPAHLNPALTLRRLSATVSRCRRRALLLCYSRRLPPISHKRAAISHKLAPNMPPPSAMAALT